YVTPKGKPQVFRAKTVRQAWERLDRFFRECTDADPLRPVGTATLVFSESAETHEQPGLVAALDKLREVLGVGNPSAWTGLGVIYPEAAGTVLGSGGVQHRWSLKPEQLEV